MGIILTGKGNISFSRRRLASRTPSLPRSVKRFIISCKAVESPLQFFLSSSVFHVYQNRNIFLKKFQIYEVDSCRKREINKSKCIKRTTTQKREMGSPTIGTCAHGGRKNGFACHISIFDVLPNFHVKEDFISSVE
jgi:hypothetical protein